MKKILLLSLLIIGCQNSNKRQAEALANQMMKNFNAKVYLEYVEKGKAKEELEDYKGAISDYNLAIKTDSTSETAYYLRGYSKAMLEDHSGAIEDHTKAIEIDPDFANAYYRRGYSKYLLGYSETACIDWKKATNLGHTNAAEWVKEFCN